MIIDVHGHILAPPALYIYREFLIGTRGHYGRKNDIGLSYDRSGKMPPELNQQYAEEHIKWLDAVGTDVQLLSARPYSLMHSERPPRIVHWWAEACNNAIQGQIEAFPTRFQGICNMPQAWGEPIETWFDELDRCVNDLGFVGVLINPDPSEGRSVVDVPPLGHEFWYPLYEKMVQYDIPGIVHSCGCVNQRENQSLHFISEESVAVMSLAGSSVFKTFPNLKIIIPHGGGAIPYQLGRFRGTYWDGVESEESFDDAVRRLYYDTSLYSEEAVALLFRAIGTKNIVLGTERPGDGSHRKTDEGHWADDLHSVIEALPGYTDEEKADVYGNNALRLFTRLAKTLGVDVPAAP